MTTDDLKRAREVARLLDMGKIMSYESEAASIIRSLCDELETMTKKRDYYRGRENQYHMASGPMTKDGVLVPTIHTPYVWHPECDKPLFIELEIDIGTWAVRHDPEIGETRHWTCHCYSTRESALAAAGKEKA